ncbi:hypothetical protein LTR94_003295 [Friedmanniomyces endolithicus]|nr:hypothetical protein LTR94_003295 [Friedmanniomyces endolithicus]
MSKLIASLSLLSIAAAQTGVIPTGLPSASGYPTPGNITACPRSVDSLCAYDGQTTFCYDASSVLYTITCGMCFDGEVIEPTQGGSKVKRDDYFDSAYVTLADCTSVCDAQSSCLAVNVLDGASCEMVTTIAGITIPAAGSVAAYKGYWGYNSTIPGGPPSGSNTTVPTNVTVVAGVSSPATTSVGSSTGSMVSASSTSASSSALPTSSSDSSLSTSSLDSIITSTSSSVADAASIGSPPVSADNATAVVAPTAFSSTTYAAITPSGVNPSAGFGFSSGGVVPLPPAGTAMPGGAGASPPSDFPSAGSFPTCASVTCSLTGTPSTPFCHDSFMQLYTINCGVTFMGATMFTVPKWKFTLETCVEACDSSAGCQAVNFDREDGACTEVSGVTGINFGDSSIVGAWRGYWPSVQPQASGTAPSRTAPSGTAPRGTAPVGTASGGTAPVGTAPVGTAISSSVLLGTGLTSSTVSVGAAGTSGFPTISVNSSGIATGPTGTGRVTGTFPTGAFPTGGFPSPSGGAGNGSYPACSETSCQNARGTATCVDSKGQVYTLNCGMKFKGTIGYNATAAGSQDSCESMCDSLPRCLGFNYGFGQCQFMYTVTGVQYPAYGYVAAWRGVWQGGAPGGAPPQGGPTGTSGLPINSANSTATSCLPANSANSTVTSGLPAISANSTSATSVPIGTGSVPASTTSSVATSGLPSISVNSSVVVGPTGFLPTGISSTRPVTTGVPSNGSFNACAAGSCSSYSAVYCPDSAGQVYSVNCGLLFKGTLGNTTVSATGLAGCSAFCDASASCLAYNYAVSNSTCSLLTAVTGIEFPAPGYTGAYKGYWAGGAPPRPSSGIPVNSANSTRVVSPTGSSGLPVNSANGTSATPVGPETSPIRTGISASSTPFGNGTVTISLPSATPIGPETSPIGTGVSASPTASANGTVTITLPSATPVGPETSPIGTGVSVSLSPSTNVTTTGSSTVAIPTVSGSSGFPSASKNSTSYLAGPTGFFPTGHGPIPTSRPTNVTSCARTSCQNGQTYCLDSQGQLYTLNCGMKFTGPSYNVSASSLDACEQSCDSQPRCLGANFNGQQCQLVTVVTGIEFPAPGWTAAWKGIWAGGAPAAPSSGVPNSSANATTPVALPSSAATNSANSTTPVALPSGVPTISANATSTSSIPLGTGSVLVSTSSVLLTSSSPSSSFSSSVTVPLGTATSGIPTISANSSFPVGPTSFPSRPTGFPSPLNGTYTSCAQASCSNTTQGATFCTDAEGQLYTINCGLKFTGTVSSSADGPTGLEQCAEYCDAHQPCLGLNYDGAQCEFLSAVTGVQYPAPGWMAAWHGSWAGGAPNGTAPSGVPVPTGNSTLPTQNATSTSATQTAPIANSTASAAPVSTSTLSASASSGFPVPSPNGTTSITSSSVAAPIFTSTTSVLPSSGFPASPTNGSAMLPVSTGTPGNGTYPRCSPTGDCMAPYQQSYCKDAAGQVYTTTCGIAFEGTPVDGPAGSSLLDCEAGCDSETACIALNFDGSKCTYVSAVTGIEPKNGLIAAWKGVWSGGAPTNGSAPFPVPSNGSIPISGHLPAPSVNVTLSSNTVGPVIASATTTASASGLSSSSNSSAPLTTSATSATTTSASSASISSANSTSASVGSTSTSANSTSTSASSTSSIVITTGAPSSGNGSAPHNATYSSCSSVHCAAPFQQSFCTDAAGQVYTLTCGLAFNGTYLNVTSSPSLLQCEASCDLSSACIALNYAEDSCTFLSTVTGTEPKNGSIAAWKGEWYGGAPSNGTTGFPQPPIGTSLTPANETTTSSALVNPITASVTSASSSVVSIETTTSSAPVDSVTASTTSASSSSISTSTVSVDSSNSTSSSVSSTTILSSSASANTTSSTISLTSSLSSSNVPTAVSSSSSVAPISTGTPGRPGNSSYPTNSTISSCDAPTTALCAAGYGLGSSSFCKDASEQVYTITCGIQFVGPVLSNTSASSLLACEQQCDVSPKCVALNYVGGNACSLVGAIYGVQNATDSIAAYQGIWAGGAPNGTTGGNGTVPSSPPTALPTGTSSVPRTSASSTASTTSPVTRNAVLSVCLYSQLFRIVVRGRSDFVVAGESLDLILVSGSLDLILVGGPYDLIFLSEHYDLSFISGRLHCFVSGVGITNLDFRIKHDSNHHVVDSNTNRGSERNSTNLFYEPVRLPLIELYPVLR